MNEFDYRGGSVATLTKVPFLASLALMTDNHFTLRSSALTSCWTTIRAAYEFRCSCDATLDKRTNNVKLHCI